MLSTTMVEARFALLLRDMAYHPNVFVELVGRPTACMLTFTPDGKLILVQSAKKREVVLPALPAFAPPQGGIEIGETLPQAAERELGEELGLLESSLLNLEQCRFLGHWPHITRRGKRKELLGVFIPMTTWVEPVLNDENNAWALVSGYQDLAKRVRGCTYGKRQALLHFLGAAAARVPAFARAWGPVPEWLPERIGVR